MLYLNSLYDLPAIWKRLLRQHTQRCLKVLRATRKDVSITFCSNAYIQKLNAAYRKINKPTDVLSFSLDGPEMLGDIFIAVPQARANAREYGNTVIAELLYLIIHGLCHLSGHDHSTAAETTRMHRAEKTSAGAVA